LAGAPAIAAKAGPCMKAAGPPPPDGHGQGTRLL
jgi:hypothetical protein